MRLSEEAIKHIKEQTHAIFGPDSCVYLFGSRTDDHKKGGYIDLLVEAGNVCDETAKIARLKAKLHVRLGLQKIDVVVARDPNRLIEQEAAKTKVCL